MYKLLIADDEDDIRSGLATVVQWEKIGFSVTGVFGDGKDVLAFLERNEADVILTDIVMPNASGIDIAQWIHENNRDTVVVFLSSFSEFKLAQQAIQYGVRQYLLKPTNLTEIYKTFDSLRQQMDRTRSRAQKIYDMKLCYGQLLFSQMIHGFFDSALLKPFLLVMGEPNPGEEYFWGCFRVAFCYGRLIDDQDLIRSVYISLNNEAGQAGGIFIPLKLQDQVTVFFLLPNRSGAAAPAHDNLVSLSSAIDRSFSSLTKLFGAEYQKDTLQLYASCDELAACLRQKFKADLPEERYRRVIQRIISDYRNLDPQALRAAIAELNDNSEQSIVYLRQIGLMAAMQIKNRFQDSVKIDSEEIYRNLFAETDAGRVHDYIASLLDEYISLHTNSAVDKACLYIQSHLSQKVKLNDVANAVYLNPAYLSRVFKRKTGVNINDYIMRLKMEKAKELLQKTNLKIYEIGDSLGYSDIRYFYKIFNSIVGVSPTQYRNEHIGLKR